MESREKVQRNLFAGQGYRSWLREGIQGRTGKAGHCGGSIYMHKLLSVKQTASEA